MKYQQHQDKWSFWRWFENCPQLFLLLTFQELSTFVELGIVIFNHLCGLIPGGLIIQEFLGVDLKDCQLSLTDLQFGASKET